VAQLGAQRGDEEKPRWWCDRGHQRQGLLRLRSQGQIGRLVRPALVLRGSGVPRQGARLVKKIDVVARTTDPDTSHEAAAQLELDQTRLAPRCPPGASLPRRQVEARALDHRRPLPAASHLRRALRWRGELGPHALKPAATARSTTTCDGEVVNVFRVLRDPETAAELRRRMELTPFAREEFRAAYDRADRRRRPRSQDDRARLHGLRQRVHDARMHMTGFRFNSNRSGTTPATDWAHWPRAHPRDGRAAARRGDREQADYEASSPTTTGPGRSSTCRPALRPLHALEPRRTRTATGATTTGTT
jgi:hypothetical protein